MDDLRRGSRGLERTDCLPKARIPEGEAGPWKVEKFEIDESGAWLHNLHSMVNFGRFAGKFRPVQPGPHSRLLRDGKIIMSDTDSERTDHMQVFIRADGHVMIAGLGLGIAVDMAFIGGASRVTVIEKSTDVIELTGPTMMERHGGKLAIVPCDIFSTPLVLDALKSQVPDGDDFRPDYMWFDIWDDISNENIDEFITLRNRYLPWVKGEKGKNMGFWCEEECFGMQRAHDFLDKAERILGLPSTSEEVDTED